MKTIRIVKPDKIGSCYSRQRDKMIKQLLHTKHEWDIIVEREGLTPDRTDIR